MREFKKNTTHLMDVVWNEDVFDGKKNLLPNKNQIYYVVEINNEVWSVFLLFEESPRIQGYFSKGKIRFLVENAPHHLLREGITFDLQLGKLKVAKCIIGVECDTI
jgi:hypothetical protein